MDQEPLRDRGEAKHLADRQLSPPPRSDSRRYIIDCVTTNRCYDPNVRSPKRRRELLVAGLAAFTAFYLTGWWVNGLLRGADGISGWIFGVVGLGLWVCAFGLFVTGDQWRLWGRAHLR
jgi:hypothetical protein